MTQAAATAAALQGSFSDFKIIKTRSVAQLIVEVPLEAADAALAALGGIPQPGQERPVAVARLEASVLKQQLKDSVELERKKSLAQQAGTLCNDVRFRTFLTEEVGEERCGFTPVVDAEQASVAVRVICRVESRREFDTNPEAAERWRNLRADFLAWERM